ncbi:MAG TPA: PilZ domain-containing protein, partial [Gemmataceae bacterium]|nr:PilZ domain-containing protein [Gemmataceae bacterium]
MSEEEEAATAEQAVGAERRVEERFPCELETFCREQGPDRGEWQALRVHNVSATGIGLVTPHRLRPGTVLVLRLAGRAGGVSRPIVVRVMHVTPLDDGWLTGAMFVRPIGGGR